jgi:hypothetical protein
MTLDSAHAVARRPVRQAHELRPPGVGHLTLIGTLAPGLRVLAPVLRDVIQFVWRVTQQADLCDAQRQSTGWDCKSHDCQPTHSADIVLSSYIGNPNTHYLRQS